MVLYQVTYGSLLKHVAVKNFAPTTTAIKMWCSYYNCRRSVHLEVYYVNSRSVQTKKSLLWKPSPIILGFWVWPLNLLVYWVGIIP